MAEHPADPERRRGETQLAHPRAWSAPDPDKVDGETLYQVFQVDCTESSGTWLCPLCPGSQRQRNTSRLYDHCLTKHHRFEGMLQMLECSAESKCRGTNRAALLQKIRNMKMPGIAGRDTCQESEDNKSTMDLRKIFQFNPHNEVASTLAECVIDGELPFAICENQWPAKLIQVGIRIGAHSTHAHLANLRETRARYPSFDQLSSTLPRATDFRVARQKLTSEVDVISVRDIENAVEVMCKSAKLYGITQVSDGRSNISNDPLLVFGVQSGTVFLPLGAHNAGSNKKDAEYLFSRHVEYLDENHTLSDETYASVADGAAAAQAALRRLTERENLVGIVCQSHGISNFIKDVSTKGVFKSTVTESEALVQWIRSHPRIHSIVKRVGNKPVTRFVPVRFGTYLIGCVRLLELRIAITKTITEEDEYTEYRRVQSEEICKKMSEMETLITNKDFWLRVKAYCTVLLPAMVALREMDRSLVRCQDVSKIWDVLEHRIRIVEPIPFLTQQVKDEVLTILKTRRKTYHRPVFDAAWALDPENAEEIRAAVRDPTNEFASKWPGILKNTEEVLRLMCRRKAVIMLRQKKRKEVKEAVVKRQRTDGFAAISVFQQEVDSAPEIAESEIEEKFAELWQDVSTGFAEYYSGTGRFSDINGNVMVLKTGSDWIRTTCGMLKYFAPRVLYMSCTISNVERLHKVYSRIHTSTRNSLKGDRVDRLTLARICRRILDGSKLRETLDFSYLQLKDKEKTTKTTEERDDLREKIKTYEQDVSDWGDVTVVACLATSRAIATPSNVATFEMDIDGVGERSSKLDLEGPSEEYSHIEEISVDVDVDDDPPEGLEV